MAGPRLSTGLEALGVDRAGEQTYRAVLGQPGSAVDILADRVGRPVEEVLGDVAALLASGLVTVVDGHIHPEPPQVALGRLLAREARELAVAQEALARARLAVSRYEVEHRLGLIPETSPTGVEILEPSDTRSVLDSLAATTVGEMLFLRPSQWRGGGSLTTDLAVTDALRAGRRSRVIYPIDVTDHPGTRHRDRVTAGEQARLLPQVPCRLAVFGTEAVVLPLSWDEPAVTAVLVRQPGIVSMCRAWFECLWTQAVDFTQTHDGAQRGRAELLPLLGLGLQDERIARTLGVSLRTVRRRVAELIADLGVESRFQAGAEAVRRGWI